ncbi:MAG: segregation/condensation protein A, partial [Candidatus Omnitrophica bacterium]|nr:segregation/condensation protein A [Candidatus Omnitrophota bacterium]
MRYEVETDLYDGPLWLLVELTRLNLIDIFLVQLAKLTGSYLQDLKRLDVGLNELSEPLPLLGNLLALKARGLLPQPETPLEDEEVPVSLEELERRLKEYEQFKTVAQLLAELHALQHEHFSRKPSGAPLEEPSEKEAAEAEKWGVSVTDLMGAFTRVLRKTTAPLYNVKAEPWTVEMKVEELRVALMVKRQL